MTPSDSLFDLIQSLTASEKRFFKIYASRHVLGESNNYVSLFDVIGKQSQYDEAGVKAHFQGEAIARNLPSAKNYLSKLILRSMRVFHQEKNVDSQLRALISDLEFLRDKKLHRQFDKLFSKAKSLAIAHEKHTVLLDLMELERFRFKEKSRKGLVEGANAISQEMHGIIEKKKTEVEYTSLLDSLYILLRKGTDMQHGTLAEQIEDMMASPLLQDSSKADSFVSRMYYHQTKAIGYQMKGLNAPAAEHYAKVVHNWNTHPKQIDALPRLYRKSLANYLASLHLIKDYDQFPTILKAIRSTASQKPLDQADVFRLAAFYELIFCLGKGDYKAGTLLSLEIESGLGRYQKWIDPAWKLVLCYNMAMAHFFHQEFQIAQIWLNQVVNIDQTEQRKDVQAAASLILLAVHLERGNFDLLESSLNSLKYRLSKQDSPLKHELILAKYFSLALNLAPKHLARSFFQPLHQELSLLAQESSNAPSIGIQELIKWSDQNR